MTDAMTATGLLDQTGGFALTAAGLAGAKVCQTFLDNGWVARVGSGRAVRLTPNGGAALRDLLGLSGVD